MGAGAELQAGIARLGDTRPNAAPKLDMQSRIDESPATPRRTPPHIAGRQLHGMMPAGTRKGRDGRRWRQ